MNHKEFKDYKEKAKKYSPEKREAHKSGAEMETARKEMHTAHSVFKSRLGRTIKSSKAVKNLLGKMK